MADIAASVLARLKSKAAESGRSYQLCLQLFCQEEFLRRLEKSKYAENLVLKGGLFLYSLTDFDSRVTVDVDFLLRQVPNTPEQLKSLLEEIITVPTGNDFVTFEIKDVAPIAVAKKYAGIGASIVARIKNTRTPFSIDFGVGDVIVPKQEKRQRLQTLPLLLNLLLRQCLRAKAKLSFSPVQPGLPSKCHNWLPAPHSHSIVAVGFGLIS